MKNNGLACFSTKELSEELSRREGVTQLKVPPYDEIKITAGDQVYSTSGPAVILINQD